MTPGKVVYRPGPTCKCVPPTVPSSHGPVPAEPNGTIWRCDCGRAWEAFIGGWAPLDWREVKV